MTRIVHVSDHYLPRVGGIEMHISDLVRHQQARGHDARVLTTAPAGSTTDVEAEWVQRISSSAPNSVLQSVLGVRALGEVLSGGGCDIVHLHISVISPFATAVARWPHGWGSRPSSRCTRCGRVSEPSPRSRTPSWPELVARAVVRRQRARGGSASPDAGAGRTVAVPPFLRPHRSGRPSSASTPDRRRAEQGIPGASPDGCLGPADRGSTPATA